jgi:hypothetical protein
MRSKSPTFFLLQESLVTRQERISIRTDCEKEERSKESFDRRINMPVPTVNQEKKHRFLRSIVWTVFTLALVLPLTFFLAPIWLCIQTLEAYLPIRT